MAEFQSLSLKRPHLSYGTVCTTAFVFLVTFCGPHNLSAQNVTTVEAERAKINSRLVETAKLIQKSEAHLTQIETRLGELEAQEKNVRETIAQRNNEISKLLGALQRMGRNPPSFQACAKRLLNSQTLSLI